VSADPLLEVRDLEKHYPVTRGLFRRDAGTVRAVDGVSFAIDRGETLGLVGESGCGKSTVATTMLHVEEPTGGEVYFDGERVGGQDTTARKRFRRRTGMVFQDPNAALDPRMPVGESVAEPLRVHGVTDPERRREVVVDLLERVGLAREDFGDYPHEFSGGQKQRLGLARALVVNPDLLVADEPVSGLDVSVQAEILDLLEELRREFGLAVLFVSHDTSVIRQVSDRVAVMYLGEIVELAPADRLFEDPQHPYTEALLGAVPSSDPRERGIEVTLTGEVPDPSDPPEGCRFHTRCPAVVPPEGYDLPQDEWRALLDLRLRAPTFDVEAFRERLNGEEFAAAVREEFGLPPRLADGDAERALDAALDDLAAGDAAAATEELAEAFPTPCRSETPALEETEAGWPAACHRRE
jgi:peptide/nickel transport system ATP-binding protein